MMSASGHSGGYARAPGGWGMGGGGMGGGDGGPEARGTDNLPPPPVVVQWPDAHDPE